MLASCQDLFGSHQLVRNGTCLYHQRLQWLSCEIGDSTSSSSSSSSSNNNNHNALTQVGIHPGRIQGSMGGESLEDVLGRPEEEEQLKFSRGSLILLSSESKNEYDATISPRLIDSVDSHMRRFLQSAITLPAEGAAQEGELGGDGSSSFISLTEQQKSGIDINSTWDEDDDITLLVRRGNYANPCMALLTMYNVYIVLEHYYNYFRTPQMKGRRKRPSLHIIWLDGHAQGDLDPVWHQLFQTQPWHIKQLDQKEFPSGGSKKQHQAGPSTPSSYPGVVWFSGHVMVVNTMSAIGDEGLGMYHWGRSAGHNGTNNHYFTVVEDRRPHSSQQRRNDVDDCSKKDSTLMNFRNFVLQQYGLLRHTTTTTTPVAQEKITPKLLTLLVRQQHYRAHPRSTGETDRTLTTIEADVAYLQTQYPSHSIQVVSFEGMPFQQQLQQIHSTDVLVAVHGAGNIHVLFLPDHATIVEYIPKSFSSRARRFRYLAECLPNNITYIAKRAWIDGRRKPQPQPYYVNGTAVSPKNNHGNTNNDLLQLRLRPQTSRERENENIPWFLLSIINQHGMRKSAAKDEDQRDISSMAAPGSDFFAWLPSHLSRRNLKTTTLVDKKIKRIQQENWDIAADEWLRFHKRISRKSIILFSDAGILQ